MKGVKHYLKNGTEWKGGSHKMSNGNDKKRKSKNNSSIKK